MARRAIAAVAAVGLLSLSAPLGVASIATAYPGQEVLIFAHPEVNDTSVDGEVDNYEDEIQATGASTTRFDGGDGSAAAWAAALEGIDLLFFPEEEGNSDDDAPPPPLFRPGADVSDDWLSDAAAEVIGAWINEGGEVLFAGSIDGDDGDVGVLTSLGPLLEVFTALPYGDAWQVLSDGEEFELSPELASTSLPPVITWEDGTYSSVWSDLWNEELLAPLTPVYVGGDGQLLAVGIFEVCQGRVSFSGYDGYVNSEGEPPIDDELPIEDGSDVVDPAALFTDEDWAEVVHALVDGTIPALGAPSECVEYDQEPDELAETGLAADAPLIAGAAGLALLGGVALMAVRRRVTAQL